MIYLLQCGYWSVASATWLVFYCCHTHHTLHIHWASKHSRFTLHFTDPDSSTSSTTTISFTFLPPFHHWFLFLFSPLWMFLLRVNCYCEMMAMLISCVITQRFVSFTNAWLSVTLCWNDDHTTKTHTMLQCSRWKSLVLIYNETLRLLWMDGWMDDVRFSSSVRVSRAFHSVTHTRVQRSLSHGTLDKITYYAEIRIACLLFWLSYHCILSQ